VVSVYLDASAVGNILLEETESALLPGCLDERGEAGTSLVSSVLVE
jgi:hypothetical protein